MSDLTPNQAAQPTKIVGVDSSGNDTNFVNADATGSLYVAPKSGIPDITVTGTLTALGQTVVTTNCSGYQSYAMYISGTWTGFISIDVSADNGATWIGTYMTSLLPNSNNGAIQYPTYSAASVNGTYVPYVNGAINMVRVRASGSMTGSASIKLVCSASNCNFVHGQLSTNQWTTNSFATSFASTQGTIPVNTIYTSNSDQTFGMAGVVVATTTDQTVLISIQQSLDNSTWTITDSWWVDSAHGDGRPIHLIAPYFRMQITNPFTSPAAANVSVKTTLIPVSSTLPRSLTQDGNLPVELRTGSKNTYSCYTNAFTTSSSSDFFGISSTPGTVIRVLRAEIVGTQSTSSTKDIVLIKRSDASSGTHVNISPISHDSRNVASNATISQFSATPTSFGSLIGIVRTGVLPVLTTSLAAADSVLVWEFGNRPGSQGIVLRDNESLYFALSAAASSVTWRLGFEWTEE